GFRWDRVINSIEVSVTQKARSHVNSGLRLAEHEGFDDLGSPAPQTPKLTWVVEAEGIARRADAQHSHLGWRLTQEIECFYKSNHRRAVSPQPSVDKSAQPRNRMSGKVCRCG